MSGESSSFSVNEAGSLLHKGREIANFSPMVTRVFCPADATVTTPPYAVSLSVRMSGQPAERLLTIPCKDLQRLSFDGYFPDCIYELGMRPSAKELVIQYIREQLAVNLSRGGCAPIYLTSGWYTHPAFCFIAGTQRIGNSPDDTFLIHPRVSARQLADSGKLADGDAVETLIRTFGKMPLSLPVFAFTVISSLRSILQKEHIPTAFVLYIVGRQGFGKTTLAKQFCTLFDDVASGQISNVFDAHSTDAAMREALTQSRDQVVLLDDICFCSNPGEQRRRRDLAVNLVRAAANETSITRMCGKTVETLQCAASLVITGEFPLDVSSELTRYILLEVDKPLTGNTAGIRASAAATLRAYLKWFALHAQTERARLCEEYRSFKEANHSRQEERLQVTLWELSWAMESFSRFAQSIGVVSAHAAQQISAVLNQTLHRIFRYTLKRISSSKPALLQALGATIALGIRSGRIPYRIHGHCLCVRSEPLTDYLRAVSQNPGLTVKDVTAALGSQGLLCKDQSGKSTRKIDGCRYLTIPLSKLPPELSTL